MSLLETFQLSIKNILSCKTRTFLTMLGIIIGVCAVIVIVGLGNGMQGYIEDSFDEMGTTVMVVTHEKELVNAFSKRVITIDGGNLISDGMDGYYSYEIE